MKSRNEHDQYLQIINGGLVLIQHTNSYGVIEVPKCVILLIMCTQDSCRVTEPQSPERCYTVQTSHCICLKE